MSTVGVISKVFSYLDRTPKCKKEGELAPERLEGRIVFQNVTFKYPSSPDVEPALKVLCVLQHHISFLMGLNMSSDHE